MKRVFTSPSQTLTVELELMVELFPAPANRVDASDELSIGRAHASTDHGALSYILQKYKLHVHRKSIDTGRETGN